MYVHVVRLFKKGYIFFSFKTSTKTQSILLIISILVILTFDKFHFVTPIRSFDTFTFKLTFSFSHSRIRNFILIFIFTQIKGTFRRKRFCAMIRCDTDRKW